MGGKSSKTVIGYKYYIGFQMILARCIHKVLSISVDNNQAWVGEQINSGVISVNAPNLFGGNSGSDPEGGLVGDVAFQQGLDSQTPDTYLQSKLGSNIPASRLVSGLVAHQIYSGNSPYMKQWSVQGERIHIDDDGNTQWYDEKAEIVSPDTSLLNQVLTDFAGLSWKLPCGASESADNCYCAAGDSSSYTVPGDSSKQYKITFRVRGVVEYNQYSGGTQLTPSQVYQNPTGFTAFTNTYKLQVSSPAASYYLNNGTISLTDVRSVDYLLTIPVNGGATLTLTANSVDSVELKNNLGLIATDDAPLNPLVVLQPYNGQFLQIDANNIGFVRDMNPAHMIRECLLNNEWGYGYDETDIDETNFTAVADTLFGETFGLSYFWEDSQTELDDVLQKFEDTVGCSIYVDRATLKWTIKLIRADYDASALPIFTLGNEILEVDSFNRPAFMDLINTEQITYSSNIGTSSPTITIPNPALLLQQGVTKSQQTSYEMVCNGFLASRLAQRDLLVDSFPLASGIVYLSYTADTKLLHRGAVCKLTMPLHNMTETVVRVTDVSFGDGTTKRVKMSFAEDQFALNQRSIVTSSPASPGSGAVAPIPVLAQIAMEVPYYFLVLEQGQQTTDDQLANDPNIGIVGISAARPSGGLSADLYVDSGSGYVSSGKCDFCPYGVLAADLPLPGLTGGDTFTLVNYEDLDELSDNHILQIGTEFVSGVYAGSGVFTSVVRACLDSVPAKHFAGDTVLGVMDYIDSDNVDYAASETINLKLLTNSTGGVLPIASATAASVTVAGRASKPYPPAKVQIASSYFPATISGTFAVTWATRNRQQQTAGGAPLGFLDSSITPVVNTRYSLLFKDHTGALLVQRDNIGPATASVALGVTDTITMELWTVDDIGSSTYRFSTTFGYTHTGGVTTNTITATSYTPVDTTTIIDGGSL